MLQLASPLLSVLSEGAGRGGEVPKYERMMKMKMKQFKIPVTSTIEVDLVKRLDEYTRSTGISKTDVINEAVREYLEKQEKKN